jgi:hypothetical protein
MSDLSKNTHWLRRLTAATRGAFIGALIGGFVGALCEGVAGGGHGSPIPLVLCLGLPALLITTPVRGAFVGAITYAIYGLLARSARRSRLRLTGMFVLAMHYMSAIALALIWWRDVTDAMLTRLDRSLESAPFAFVQSLTLFVIAHILLARANEARKASQND